MRVGDRSGSPKIGIVNLNDQIERLRVISALRIALVMVVCIALAVMLDMRSGVFAIFPVLVISFMFHDESPVAGVSLVAGSVLGAAISTITIDLFLRRDHCSCW